MNTAIQNKCKAMGCKIYPNRHIYAPNGYNFKSNRFHQILLFVGYSDEQIMEFLNAGIQKCKDVPCNDVKDNDCGFWKYFNEFEKHGHVQIGKKYDNEMECIK